MTIQIPVKPNADPQILIFHSEKNAVKGYTLRVTGTLVDVFIDEANADKIARYMLFSPSVEDSIDVNHNSVAVKDPLGPAYMEKTPQED